MVVYEPDFSAIREALTETWALGWGFMIPLALAIVGLALITRDTEKWKILFFPILALERIIGIPVHFLILTFGAIMFALEILSLQVIGSLIGAAKKWVSGEKELEKQEKILGLFKRAEKHEEKLRRTPLSELQSIFGSRSKVYRKQREWRRSPEALESKPKKKQFIKLGGRKFHLYEKNEPYFEGLEKKNKISFKPKKNENKESSVFKPTANKSWEAYQRHGPRLSNTGTGKRLGKALAEQGKRLKRKLTQEEVRKLYQKIGRRSGKYE